MLDAQALSDRALPGDDLAASVVFHAALTLQSRRRLPNHIALYAPLEPFITAASV